MSRIKRLILEIHHRSLWQVLLIYVGGALVAYQAVQALTEGLGLPQWFPGLAVVLFIVGLPIVVATACVHEVPTRAEPPVEVGAGEVAEAAAAHREARRRHRFLTWRNAAATFVIVLAAWGVVATGWLLFGRGADEGATADERPSVAVLPLVNRSGLEEDRYFTDGIHDEILTQLYKVSGLSVRGRTSVMEYRDSPKNLRQIGEELNARYLLEGGVQRAGETVRINVQLIDAEADEHVFADTYDRELSVENLLAIQREVALRIADALEARLTPAEREHVEARPTDNLEAYDYYLRGQDLVRTRSAPGATSWTEAAARSFTHAIELDPQFALAYARLSFVNAYVYWWIDRTEEQLARAWSAAESALRIDTDLAEGHLALGLCHYWGERDYDSALRELDLALTAKPGDSEILGWTATVLRRAGKFEEAETMYLRARELDPLSRTVWYNLRSTQVYLREFEAAEETFRRSASLFGLSVSLGEIRLQLWGKGSTAGALRLIEERSASDPWRGLFQIAVCERRYSAALEVLSVELEDVHEEPAWVVLPTLFRGQVYALMNDEERSRAEYDTARMILEPLVQERPDDDRLQAALGIAYAGLGRKSEAIEEGRRATELVPLSRDALSGSHRLIDLAEIYTMVGEVDAAIEVLEEVLSVPSLMTVQRLRLQPTWDPLRDHPRFQALLER